MASGSAKRQRPETEIVTVQDTDALNCGVCYQPLKPPIFQCKEGHALCSPCRDKLAVTGKCHVCGVAMRGGYYRNRALERLVETAHVACPNAVHGCDARLVYYGLPDHRQMCPHAPCHCPGKACGFVGTTKQLLDHITGSHNWPYNTRNIICHEMSVSLQDGFNFVALDHMIDGKGNTITSTVGVFLFLLDVSRQPLGRAISVVCIHPHRTYGGQGPSSIKALECKLCYSRQYSNDIEMHFNHYQTSELRVKCTDLCNGLPSIEQSFKFVVPNFAVGDEDKEVIDVKVGFTISRLC